MSSFPHRGFRFGVQVSKETSARGWAELARRAEGAGYDVFTMPDHFTDQLAPIPALMAAADATTKLRIGALVFDNDYKHPVVLAKELATMDLLSDGRVEIGLGAGWMMSDYEEAGIPYDSPKVRIDRFIEGVAVIRGAMADGPFSFSGDHYNITNYNGQPKPVQKRPPLLIGGGGKRVLSYAAREADIIGIHGTMTAGVVGPEALATMTAESVDEKVAIVAAAGAHRLNDIEMNIRTFFVKVTDDRAKALEHALACKRVVIEEFLNGPEISLFGISDGRNVLPMQPAQDFKRALDGDQGPNTGGMGAYSPLPWAPSDIIEDTHKQVLAPMIAEMAARGTPFVGLLYAGLALTDHGTRVIEFNARFGDPETQVLIPLLKTPLATLLYNAATGNLKGTTLDWNDDSAVTVVLAAEGYPAAPKSGGVITGFSAIDDVQIYHAGTSTTEQGVVASGGRVLTVTGIGEDLTEARNRAYRAISQIRLSGSFYRTDIALNASVAEKGN